VTAQNTIWNIDPEHSTAEFILVGDEITINLDVEFVKA
jgi:hypothetical protein